jgi:septum formation inhibitor-activating ATPase MinD
MKQELEIWLRVKADCEASIEKHGAIIEAQTDRGQLVIRSNPAIASLAQAKRMIEKLRKEQSNQTTLEL